MGLYPRYKLTDHIAYTHPHPPQVPECELTNMDWQRVVGSSPTAPTKLK
jgi:hypothetical protein